MKEITTNQRQALRLVATGEITGRYINYVWRFTDGSLHAHTAAVMALSAKALVTITYYDRSVAGVDLSERGRALISKMEKDA